MCDTSSYDEHCDDCYDIFSSMVMLRGRPDNSSGVGDGSCSDSRVGQLDG